MAVTPFRGRAPFRFALSVRGRDGREVYRARCQRASELAVLLRKRPADDGGQLVTIIDFEAGSTMSWGRLGGLPPADPPPLDDVPLEYLRGPAA